MAEIIAEHQDMVESQEVGKDELTLASEVLHAMIKTSKGFKMYMPNNPLLVKFIDDLKEKMERQLTLYGEYRLEIDQFELRYRGKVIYENRDPKESIAFKMYSDGIRFFIFGAGVEEHELCGFLEIIGKERPGEVDDDIVTLLWEENYPHLTYILAEDFLEFETAAGTGVVSESQQGKISSIYSSLASSTTLPTLPLIPQKVLVLSEDELESLKRIKEEEEKRRPLDEVIQIISAILAGEKDAAMFGEFLEIMAKLVEGLANAGEVRLTFNLVRFLGNLALEEDTSPEKRGMLAAAMGAIFSERNVPVLAKVFNTTEVVSPEEIQEALHHFGRPSLGRMCELLGLVDNMKVRRVILKVLIELGGEAPEAFIPFLSDSRWYVARNMVFVLTRLGSLVGLEQIVELISHREQRVRKEVLTYLETIPDAKAKSYVMKFLRDESSALRIRALKVLGVNRCTFALKPIITIASQENFAEKGIDEKKAVFEAIGDLGADQALPMFRDMLMKKYWFNKAKEKESVICAVAGLMRLRSPAVVELLGEARKGKSEEVREIINQAILAKGADGARSGAVV